MFAQEPKGYMTKAVYDQLIQICREAAPSEACGIAASSFAYPDRSETNGIIHFPIIDTIIPITNTHINPSHAFSFDPIEWTAAYFEMQKNRQSLVGLFHSHPTTPAIPSSSDTEGFLPASELSYWIVSLEDAEAPQVMPYRRVQGAFVPMQLVLA